MFSGKIYYQTTFSPVFLCIELAEHNSPSKRQSVHVLWSYSINCATFDQVGTQRLCFTWSLTFMVMRKSK